jgi:hypothetical protein
MILAAKLAARELEPVLFADGGEIWNTEEMTTDGEWLSFARSSERWFGGSRCGVGRWDGVCIASEL